MGLHHHFKHDWVDYAECRQAISICCELFGAENSGKTFIVWSVRGASFLKDEDLIMFKLAFG